MEKGGIIVQDGSEWRAVVNARQPMEEVVVHLV